MFKQFEGARLGIFIFLSTAILISFVFLIGNKDSLFVTTISVKSYFPKIEGLKSGAPVRMNGYDIGSVSSIVLSNDTLGKVEVSMNIEEEVRRFIRLDSKASIETEGLVGKKVVAITPGSPSFAEIETGGIIEAQAPVNIAEIFEESQQVIKNLNVITEDFADIFAKINSGEGTIGRLVNDDELYASTVSITKSADKSLNAITIRMEEVTGIIVDISARLNGIISGVDSVINEAGILFSNINNGKGVIGALVADDKMYDSIKTVVNNLVYTTDETLAGAQGFAENMEALKHNWLFKTYFEDRGYWDINEHESEIQSKINELDRKSKQLDEKLKQFEEYEAKYGQLKQSEQN
ncbi:MAG: MlaD family protein [Melioribacteraceae bacterium]|nr:MlaD family protein [Melioribacteraceae bacterium]